MRGNTEVGSPQRDATETQTRNPEGKKKSRGKGTVQESEEMKMIDTDMVIDEERAQRTGEVTQLGGRRGTGGNGNETSCLTKNFPTTITKKTDRGGEIARKGVTVRGTETDTETRTK